MRIMEAITMDAALKAICRFLGASDHVVFRIFINE
jgi:hypothetical protein